jgi:hypothetical protein
LVPCSRNRDMMGLRAGLELRQKFGQVHDGALNVNVKHRQVIAPCVFASGMVA